MRKKLEDIICSFPSECGVYIFKDKRGGILYVGKATNIRERVKSHFRQYHSPRHRLLLNRIHNIEYTLLPNEESALLLEQALIKENKPPFNVELKDDKSYPYVRISQEEFPSVSIVRIRTQKQGLFLGPFTNKKILKKALNLIRRIIKFRTCRKMRKNACLNYHLGLCPGPCIGKINSQEYNENIKYLVMVLEGKRRDLAGDLEAKMNTLSSQQKFEEAGLVRDKLKALLSIYQGLKGYLQEATLLKDLLDLKKLPRWIEGIDLSTIQGSFSTGSVVVFLDGEPLKSEYRRYRIKNRVINSDLEMLREVVRRRYVRVLAEKRNLPDLILIDGGRVHLREAVKQIRSLGLDIPVIALAKDKEKIYMVGRKEPLILPENSWALHLLQRVRNEAHRFAGKYHRLLRKKSFFA